MDLAADDGLDIVEHIRQVDLLLLQLNFAAFNAAHVQHIVDEAQQVVAGGENFCQIVLHLLGAAHIGDGQGGEADDGVHGGADVVGHIAQEGGLGLIGAAGGGHGILQIPGGALLRGSVGEHQNVLLVPLKLPAQGGAVEPPGFAASLMEVFPLPFALLAGFHGGQQIQDRHLPGVPAQMVQNPDIGPGVLLRDAQQPLNVGADVVGAQVGGIQHQEDIVHIAGKGGKQRLPVQKLRVLLTHGQTASAQQNKDENSRKENGNGGNQRHGGGLKPVHAGVDHIGGDDAQQHPVLKARRLIDQIVVLIVDGEGGGAGILKEEALLKGVDFLLGAGGALLQHGKEVVGIGEQRLGIVQHHPSVGADNIGAGLTVEGGNLQGAHQIGVVEADGNGLIGKVPIGSRLGGDGEDDDLRLTGHHGGHRHILPPQNQIRQAVLQIQIAGLAAEGAVAALPGDEVEIGEAVFLLRRGQVQVDPVITFRLAEVRLPHPQGAPVPPHQIIQRHIGLMVDLRQVGGGLGVDGFGYEGIIADTGDYQTEAETQYSQSRRKGDKGMLCSGTALFLLSIHSIFLSLY